MGLNVDLALIIVILIVSGTSLIISLINFLKTNQLSTFIKSELESDKTQIEMIGDEYSEDMDGDTDSTIEDMDDEVKKEEIKLEIDKDMERINNELKKNELLMEKLEKHYSSLRKVSKDIMESLRDPSLFLSLSEDYAPVPLMDDKPLWIDLSRNHIPVERGNLSDLWEEYVNSMNIYSHLKVPAIRSMRSFIFDGTEYQVVESLDAADKKEGYFLIKPIIHIMNTIVSGEPKLEISIEDDKKPRKGGKQSVIRLNGELFAGGRPSDILTLKSLIQNLAESKDKNYTKEVYEIIDLRNKIKNKIEVIKELLNWFIFEEDNMTQCDIIG